MEVSTARKGLAYIMKKAGADRWDEVPGGYAISCKFVGRRRRRRYFVPTENVEEAERGGQIPNWVFIEISRIPDTAR
jgi:hypothetical protein